MNGDEQPYTIRSVKGFEYAMVLVKPGSDYRIKVRYTN
jgi:hypothetical protein